MLVVAVSRPCIFASHKQRRPIRIPPPHPLPITCAAPHTPSPCREAAEEKFKEISEAYDVLSDKDKREVSHQLTLLLALLLWS